MYNPAGGSTYFLNSSISSTATSITLSSFTEPVSGTPYTMVLLNTDIAYGTIAPKTTSSEFISFTGITQNSDGTATLTGVTRGLEKKYPFTESTTFKLPHAGQSQFILSDAPQVFVKYAALENNNSFTGANAFTQNVTVPDPVNNTDAANKEWVLTVVNGGPVTTSKLVISGTAGETVAAGNMVYLKASDGRWWKTDADTASTVENVMLGISQGAGTAGNSITNGVLIAQGVDANQSGLVANTVYYYSNTAGALSSTPGTKEVTAGIALSASTFVFSPRFNQQLTEDEQDALAGTSGTPSSTNKFVTNDDTSTTAVASKVVRATSNVWVAPGFVPQIVGTTVTPVTITNTRVETTVFTKSVPANLMGTNNLIKGRIYVSDYSPSIGENTKLRLRLKYGGTTLVNIVTGVTDPMAAAKGYVDFILLENNVTNAQIGQIGTYLAEDDYEPIDVSVNGSGTATEVSTGALDLVVTAQFVADNDTTGTVTFLFGYCEVIRQ